MDYSTVFTDKKVNRDAVKKFMKDCKENKTDIHSFVISEKGETKVRIAPKPYSFDYKQQLYSLSKSFSSTAIGFLYDEGLVDIEDRVVDIFSDKCPKTIGQNLSKMKLKHLLSMNTGFEACILDKIRNEDDPVKAFLTYEPQYEPGTFFSYCNAATYMLSAIVRKYKGMSMFDFLSFKLFKPLGMCENYWNVYNDRNSQGAVGLHASTDDLAKFGLLYLNKGIYNGERILSEEWVSLATKAWSDNSSNGTLDWTAGYGFQFWRNGREGYRGDGAFGQLCVILPKKEIVFAMEVYSDDMQKEMDLLFELTENLYGESKISEEELLAFVDEYNKPKAFREVKADFFEKVYKAEENPFGITFVKFENAKDSINLVFSDGFKWQTMKFGKGMFFENRIVIKSFKPTLGGLGGHDRKEVVHFAAYAEFGGEKLKLHINYLDNPHTEIYVCSFDEEGFIMEKEATELIESEKVIGKLFSL